ncbi:MAG: hypothetical protein IPK26_29115 [Planctomycetes bacterium]|nr:hypothetical protein [Planctomycetota bacterium]
MEHICHHDANSVVVGWLLMALGIVIERLYRNRYLHRGTHPVRSAADLVVILRLALGRRLHDTKLTGRRCRPQPAPLSCPRRQPD